MLSILGVVPGHDELAVKAPWTKRKRSQFNALYGEFSGPLAARNKARTEWVTQLRFDSEQLRPDAQMITRCILTRDYDEKEADYAQELPRTWVESVVPVYSTFKAVAQELDLSLASAEEAQADEANSAAARTFTEVVGWPLFVPADSEWSDEKALEAAANLARNDDYRLERDSFRDWWRQNVGAGMPPEIAVSDLVKRADRLNAIAKRTQRRTRTLRAFALMGGATAAATFWFPPVAIPSGLIAIGSVGADALLKEDRPLSGLAPAAMFYDARKQLGWY
jgi:hypothetical protein